MGHDGREKKKKNEKRKSWRKKYVVMIACYPPLKENIVFTICSIGI